MIKMNSRELVLAALSSDQTPDRVPWVEQDIHAKVVGAMLQKDLNDPLAMEKVDAETTTEYVSDALNVYADLGLDGIGCMVWTPALGDSVIIDGKVSTTALKPGILDWNTFNKLSKELPRPADLPIINYVKGWSDAMSDSNMFRALLVGMQYRMLEVSIGLENMAIWHVEKPDLLHAAAQFFCDWTCEAIRMVLDKFPFDAVWLDDDLAFKTGTFVSPVMLKEYVFPYHRKIVATAKSYGLPTMFHSDGNLSSILNDLIDSGFVSIHPLERLAFDIRSARNVVHDRITVMGNIDIDFLEKGEPDLCYNETASLIKELGPRRFILASGNAITANVKIENLKAISRAVLEQNFHSMQN